MTTEQEPLKELVVEKERLLELLEKLDGYTLYARVESGGTPLFKEVTDEKTMAVQQLDRPGNTPKSPKNIFFPEAEVLFTYQKEGGDVDIQVPKEDQGRRIVLGMRPCDAKALYILDKVFLGEPADQGYKRRRENTVVIGLACNKPHYNCFCTSVGGGPHSTEELDILLTDLKDRYYVEVLTEKGKDLVNKAADLFAEPEQGDREKKKEMKATAEEAMTKKLDTEAAVEALEGSFESEFWDEVTKGCLGCGSCTYVCPTCHCFDMRDSEGKRVRTWDSCQFPLFTLHTSSHNPRTDKKSRIRNRLYHKFKYIVDAYGRPGCVGCGRCVILCGASLDLVDILEGLVEAKKKEGEVKEK